MKNKISVLILTRLSRKRMARLFLSALLAASMPVSAQYDPLQPWKGTIGTTLEKSTPYKADPVVKAAAEAPNVVWILLDDVGYGSISSFGGLINTPNFDALAQNGLRYTNFHTTAICSPTRASLITGRNHHSVHMGLFPETAINFPGYDARIPFEKGTIAEVLRENGYNTYAVGKWHLTPVAEVTEAGPFNRWPTGRGFDHYYGFLYGETDQYTPQLVENNSHVETDTKGKHFTTLIVDKAIKYVSNQKSVAPEKPFFLYVAPGAAHAPHQVDQVWLDKYKGKFDKGWDHYRAEVLARQKKLGIVSESVVLPPRNEGIPAWEELSADERKVYARFFEAYAAFIEHTDYEIGRLINHLKSINQFDNTVIALIVGDNGASKEGTELGIANGYIRSLDKKDQIRELVKNIDLIGTSKAIANFPLGWANAANTPFRYLKQDANSEGGTRNPLILHYPDGIKDKGGIRTQYTHVNSVWPTTVELTGAVVPPQINGYVQHPAEGISLGYTFDDPKAPTRHTIQYYEIKGTRAIYKDGWKASVYHPTSTPFEDDVWELYHLEEDPTEQRNLASERPDKLKELQQAFDSEARKYNVYPLKDGFAAPFGLDRVTAYAGKSQIVLYPGLSHTFALTGPVLRNRPFSLTADVNIPSKKAQGVLYAIGGRFGGFSLFVKDGKVQVANNFGAKISHLEAPLPATLGDLKIRVDVNYTATQNSNLFDNTNLHQEVGTEVLYINNVKVAEKKILKGESANVGGYDEGYDVGRDQHSPVSNRYASPFDFTGTLKKITIDLK
jgi:arylsulfatase A-like enzyme